MAELKEYINNPYQILGTRHYTLEQGWSKGVSAIDIKTGSGLEYTVIKDRALDISLASFKGINLTYISRNGEVSPKYYDKEGSGWMKSFFGGLLTTCGPENIGKACSIKGTAFPQHGSFSNTPAFNISDKSSMEKGINISGELLFGTLGSSKLHVNRTISSPPFSSEIIITDNITNISNTDSPITMLYHTNYGFPFLSEKARMITNDCKVESYDKYSESDIQNVYNVDLPQSSNKEKNYFHYMPCDGTNYAAIINPTLGIGVLIEFSDTLPIVTHCKIECPGDYFMAVEPCNTLCLGRENIEKRNLLPIIKAGETITFTLKFTIMSEEGLDIFINEH